MKVLRRVGLYALLAALYLVSTVPVERGGFDTYMQCLRTSFELADMNYLRSKNQSCGDECPKN